jgi:hypothetical protein
MAKNPYEGLRKQVLTLDPASVRLAPSPEHPRVFGGLMEMGMRGGTASLVVIADGTTSMYYSTGGGIIGAGLHESVKRPSRVFLVMLERLVDQLGPNNDDRLPAEGTVQFRALTFDRGRLMIAAPNDDFAQKRNPLWPAFFAGHAVIGALRQLPNVQSAA